VKLNAKTLSLAGGNVEITTTLCREHGKEQTFTPLLLLIADVLDSAGSGQDCYMVIGTNKDKSSLLLTVTQDRVKGWVSGLDIAGLSEACKSLL
jgi:hypothetical protein